MNKVKQLYKHFDYPLFITYIILALFGLLMVYSSSMIQGLNKFDDSAYYFSKQLKHVLLAIPLFFIIAAIPHQRYKEKKAMVAMVVLMLASLVSVLAFGFGKEEVGSKSWIRTPIGNFQPSEFAKIIIILYFSSFFAKKNEKGTLEQFNISVGPPLVILGIVAGLVMLETDVGATLIIIFVAMTVIMASGLRFKSFIRMIITLFLVVIPMVALLLLFKSNTILTDGRQGRLKAFMDPFKYPEGSGLQIINSFLAIGSGGITGLGLGQSVQKLGYLPEPHTDMIFAVISEELGIFGTTIVLGGIGFIVFRAFSIGLKTKSPQARMLAFGLGSLFGIQTVLNIGGLTSVIPLTGVTLPFISYGGTSFILLSLALGILMNVSMFVKKELSDKGV